MDTSRKLTREQENPVDTFFYDVCEVVAPTFYRFGFTPNMVTLLSFITTMVSLNYLHQGLNWSGCLFLIVSYFFDCLDGFMARKYNMTSKLGDILDHGSDMMLAIGLVLVLYSRHPWSVFKTKMMILSMMGLFITIHMGCQEQIYTGDYPSPTLAPAKLLCVQPSWIQYTRFFGTGTMIFAICLLFLF